MINDLLTDLTLPLSDVDRKAIYGYLFKLHDPREGGLSSVMFDGGYPIYVKSLMSNDSGKLFKSLISDMAYRVNISEPRHVEDMLLTHVRLATGYQIRSGESVGLFSSAKAKRAKLLLEVLKADHFSTGLILTTQIPLSAILEQF